MRLPDVGALLGSGGDRRVFAPAQLNLLEHQGLLDPLAKLPQPASNPAPSDISAGLHPRTKKGRSAEERPFCNVAAVPQASGGVGRIGCVCRMWACS